MKKHAPATQRNKDPILNVLARVLPARGTVLEIASGSGEHAIHFASNLPHLEWQPTDHDAGAIASMEEYRAEASLPNLRAPISVDACAEASTWGFAAVDAIVSINMIHIAPWAACQGLMRGAAMLLAPEGVLFLYGPFKRGGAHTAPSNESFDADLRERDAAWGVRDLDDVTVEAEKHRLSRVEVVEMPANNLSVIFRKS